MFTPDGIRVHHKHTDSDSGGVFCLFTLVYVCRGFLVYDLLKHVFVISMNLSVLVSIFFYCFVLQRKHILQLLMFLYGEESFRENGGFSYSRNKAVAGM